MYCFNTLIIILLTISERLLVFQERKFPIMAKITNSKIIISTSTPTNTQTTPTDFVLFAYTTVVIIWQSLCSVH